MPPPAGWHHSVAAWSTPSRGGDHSCFRVQLVNDFHRWLSSSLVVRAPEFASLALGIARGLRHHPRRCPAARKGHISGERGREGISRSPSPGVFMATQKAATRGCKETEGGGSIVTLAISGRSFLLHTVGITKLKLELHLNSSVTVSACLSEVLRERLYLT